MKKLFFVAVLFIICLSSYSQSKTDSLIKVCAKEKWGSDYDMVKYEMDNQKEAYIEFFSIYNSFECSSEENQNFETVSEECEICVNAFSKWKDEISGCIDWEMVVYETKKQIDAYNYIK